MFTLTSMNGILAVLFYSCHWQSWLDSKLWARMCPIMLLFTRTLPWPLQYFFRKILLEIINKNIIDEYILWTENEDSYKSVFGMLVQLIFIPCSSEEWNSWSRLCKILCVACIEGYVAGVNSPWALWKTHLFNLESDVSILSWVLLILFLHCHLGVGI